jgi:hypothetical protein
VERDNVFYFLLISDGEDEEEESDEDEEGDDDDESDKEAGIDEDFRDRIKAAMGKHAADEDDDDNVSYCSSYFVKCYYYRI